MSPEQVTRDIPVSFDRPRVSDLFGLHRFAQHENVIF